MRKRCIFLFGFILGCLVAWAQTADSTLLDSSDHISLSFVGSGNFQAALLGQVELGSTAGLGMIFSRRWSKPRWIQDLHLDLYISVAGTTDSLTTRFVEGEVSNSTEFGKYLLQPYQSKQAGNFNMLLYFNKKKWPWVGKWLHGFSAKFFASNRNVQYLDQKTDLTGLAIRLGFFHDFMPDRIRYQKGYSILIGADYSFRGLYGDFASNKLKSVRKAILGTTQTQFHGLEFYFGFQLKNIRAEVLLPVFRKKHGEAIPGFSNTQFITGLRFVGGFPVFVEGHQEELRSKLD